MRDLGPFQFVAVHHHPVEDPGPSKFSSSAAAAVFAPPGSRPEPYNFQAMVLDCPDALDPGEARQVVQDALVIGVPLSFDPRRSGVPWSHVLERLAKYDMTAVAPSVGLPGKRRDPIIGGVRGRF